ncbi:hypothetical protein GJ496_010512, partial [Pomphorhynchus laevis]
ITSIKYGRFYGNFIWLVSSTCYIYYLYLGVSVLPYVKAKRLLIIIPVLMILYPLFSFSGINLTRSMVM